MDEARRRDERAAAGGDVAAQARMLAAKVRAGETRPEAVLLAARLGRDDARLVAGTPPAADSLSALFGAYPYSGPTFDLLVGIGRHLMSLWAFDTGLSVVAVGSARDLERDKMLLDALFRWVVDDSDANFRAVERTIQMIQVMLDATGPHIDDARHRTIAYALQVATAANDVEAAAFAINAALESNYVAVAAAQERRQSSRAAEAANDTDRRRSLARLVLLEDQPYDEDGTPRPVRLNPDDHVDGDDDEDDPDPADYLRFMSGDCWLLAVALREVTGLPIYGLEDDTGDVHHAFVLDRRAGVAIDFRGRLPVSEVMSGCRGQTIVRLDDRTLARFAVGGVISARDHAGRTCPRVVARGYSDAEWEHALAVARRIGG